MRLTPTNIGHEPLAIALKHSKAFDRFYSIDGTYEIEEVWYVRKFTEETAEDFNNDRQ